MTILHHSESLTIVSSATGEWHYERIPGAYIREVKRFIDRGYEGKAWAILRRFEHRRR